MQTWGIQWFCFMEDTELSSQLPPGPYTIHQGQMYYVRRVYSDDNYGFFRGIWHSYQSHGDFLEFHISGDRYRSVGVAVPSRIHSRPSQNTPLDGVRVGVKDNFDLCGLRTSIGSLSYYQLYPPSKKTAEAVEKLISMGADVVGKLSMSAFALMEHPMQSVDYQAPINPRGDGYQIPGGSRSGAGAAIASYEWLDLALVTDTTGSARIPALYNGCFGLRPSSGIIPMTNTKEVYLEFDTPGLMGRDLSLLHQVLESWGHPESARKVSSGPFRVIFPRDFRSVAIDEQLELLDSFAGNLAKVLSAHVEEISIAADWAASPPEQSESLDVFLHETYALASKTSTNRSRELGKKVKPQENREALRRIKVFRDWFRQRYRSTATENVLFILPIGKVGPDYCDQYPGLPAAPSTGLSATSLSPSIGAPELTLPIGEIQYHSRITENMETLPVMAGLMGMPGADTELVQVALYSLEKLGLPTKIQTGKSMFGKHSGGVFKVGTK
ncbi:unnamed protein product [Penicillium salamii]|nr:unnamed protein product [Penicillium salamii]CAG8176432.1 unnamed protein product [Penicillium salamii]CAG8368340.1 unnamed protein product [Penicillium salamii]